VYGLCDTREISIRSLDNLSNPRDLLIRLLTKKEILRGYISGDDTSTARVQIPATPPAIPPGQGSMHARGRFKGSSVSN